MGIKSKGITTGAIVSVMMLVGCSGLVRTDDERPEVDVPDRFFSDASGGHETDATTQEDDAWWERYGDAELSALIEGILGENNDIQVAALRVKRARLQAGIAEDALWIPDFNAGGDASFARALDRDESSESYSVSGGVSYAVDLWGERSAALDAAQWEAVATDWDFEGVRLSISATVATLYWQLSYLDERIGLAEESIAYAQRTLELTRDRRDAGSVTDLDVIQAQRNVNAQEAGHIDLVRQRQSTTNAIWGLFDSAPKGTRIETQRIPEQIGEPVRGGLPAEVLGRRPDVRASELRVRSSLSQINSTKASYLPSLTFSGTIGSASDTIGDLLSNPIGTLAASVALPFLNWNEMQLSVEVVTTEYQESIITFRQTLYDAITEIETALSDQDAYAAQRAELEQALALAEQSESLFEIQYRAGSVMIQDWLDAQETRRGAEVDLLDARLNQLTNQISLYEAIGGQT